jgi:hypothetical protein
LELKVTTSGTDMKNFKTEYFGNRRKIMILCLLTLIIPAVSGQVSSKEESPALKERIFFGGNFSLQLGTITNIEVSPVIGFWLRPRIAIALGPDYNYYKDPYLKTSIYGGRGYVQFVVLRDLNKFIPIGNGTGIFLHLEDEVLSLDSYAWKNVTSSPGRFSINTALAGAGLSQQIGRRAAINFMVLWAIFESDPELTSAIYSNPEIRIGFVF